MSRLLTTRLFAIAFTVLSTVAMLGVSFEAEAQRRLGGSSMGRQSSNVMQQRQAVQPPAAASTTQRGTTNSAATAGAAGAAGTAAARSGASRWFGPIAGIAAGLGLAALLSHLGMGAAFAEFMASLLLIAIAVFAVLFIFRRLRGGGARPAMQGATASGHSGRGYDEPAAPQPMQSRATPAQAAAVPPAVASHPAVEATVAPAKFGDANWYIPADFDTQNFLQNAKANFIALQDAWDRNDINQMREYMTDELIEAVREPLAQREPGGRTEVVLLNASMLGIEDVTEGHLASVRFSGMLRDNTEPEAYRFEEVWNFLKPRNGGWLLAGIQQIPVEAAN